MISANRKKENLKKMSVVELKEVLDREAALLKKMKLIEKLPDKGKSIREFHTLVEEEICYRKQLNNLESCVNNLSLQDEREKYVKKMCEFEKTLERDRYKPFATLNKMIEIKPDRKVFKTIEDCKFDNKPAKLIPLVESLNILKHQEEKIKEEQVKLRYDRLMEKLKEENVEENSASDEESSEASNLSEDEK